MSVKLHTPGSTRAGSLVKAGKVKDSASWKPPSASAENAYIEKNGLGQFGTWHLGEDTGEAEDTKGRFKFIFTSDFEEADLSALRACINRAAQAGYSAIEKRARDLYEQAKKKLGKEEDRTWFRIVCQEEETEAEIDIFDEIGGWGISAKEFALGLKAVPRGKSIKVSINSPGGNVFDGLAIHNLLAERRAKVSTKVQGLAGSIASVIALAGHRCVMPANALMMIHDPTGFVVGDSEDMRQMAATMDKLRDQLAGVYAAKTGMDIDEVKSLMAAETWFTGREALEAGLADEVEEDVVVTNRFDMSRFRNAPKISAGAGPRPASPPPPPSGGKPKDQTRNRMEKLLNALVEAKFIPSAKLDEEAVVDMVKAELRRRDDAAAADKAKIEEMTKQLEAQRKSEAESAIAQAVKDGKIKDDANLKKRWVEAYLKDKEGTVDMLAAMSGPKAPAGGGAPLPEPGDDTKLPADSKDLLAKFEAMPEGPEKTKFQRQHANQLLAAWRDKRAAAAK